MHSSCVPLVRWHRVLRPCVVAGQSRPRAERTVRPNDGTPPAAGCVCGIRQPQRGIAAMMHAMRRATSADGAVQGIQAGRYLGMTNTAVWCWRVGRVLVDTGPPNQWSIVKREIARLGGVDLVLASHHHEDHAGNGAQLQSELGCKVLAAPSSLAYLRGECGRTTRRAGSGCDARSTPRPSTARSPRERRGLPAGVVPARCLGPPHPVRGGPDARGGAGRLRRGPRAADDAAGLGPGALPGSPRHLLPRAQVALRGRPLRVGAASALSLRGGEGGRRRRSQAAGARRTIARSAGRDAPAHYRSLPRAHRAALQDAHDQIASLERVLELDFETVFCSHKGIVTDGRAALARR